VLSPTPVPHLLPKIFHIHGVAKNTCSISAAYPAPCSMGAPSRRGGMRWNLTWITLQVNPQLWGLSGLAGIFLQNICVGEADYRFFLCGWGDWQYRLKGKFLLDSIWVHHMGKRALCFHCVAALKGSYTYLNDY